jgi:Ca2+-binding RTX toxin-like protein
MASLLRFATKYFTTVGPRQAYGLELSGKAAVTGGEPVVILIGDRKTIAIDNDPEHDKVHLKRQTVLPDTNNGVLCSFTGAAAHVIGDKDNNSVVGTTLNDILEGNSGNDVLAGRGGNDQLLGGANNDVLGDEIGTNVLDGGSGYDQIVFAGKLATYSVSIDGGNATVSGAGFTDQILNAEALVFADTTVNLYDLASGLAMTVANDRLVITGTAAEDASHGQVALTQVLDAGGRPTFDLIDNGEIAIHTTLNVPSNFADVIDASGLHGAGLSCDATGTIIGSEQADSLTASGNAIGMLYGNGGDDLLIATVQSVLDGGAGDDRLVAQSNYSKDDTLIGGAGNDVLDGANGIDTAVYSGDLADYAITLRNGILTIADIRANSPDGTDKVGNVEDFIFADGEYSIREVLDHASSSWLDGAAHDLTPTHHLIQLA